MILFYTKQISDKTAQLTEREAAHCSVVLRKNVGDKIHFTDGVGNMYEGIISSTSKKDVEIEIMQKRTIAKSPFHLHIAIAPTKNLARLEWFCEKATEIGIHEISLIICKHSERKKLRMDRLESSCTAAMKQSLKAYLPQMNNPITFSDYMEKSVSADYSKFIAHLSPSSLPISEKYKVGNNVMIMIGPEGDFHKDEILLAEKHNFEMVSLGSSRLRTETAGLVACHSINFINQQLVSSLNA